MDHTSSPRKATLTVALIPVLLLMIILCVSIGIFGADPHIPLLFGIIILALVGKYLKLRWADMEESMIRTISMSMQACLILMVISILIGAWIVAGIVPTMIYYGLKILNPAIFLTAALFICSVISLATGSCYTTASTVGVALIGIGNGLGVSSAITAGAIVSGSYFGDKMSPLSDTTNLAPAIVGVPLFDHIRHMIYTTGPSYAISALLFTIIGFRYSSQSLDAGQIDSILAALEGSFHIHPGLFLPPILVILMVVKKVPALPGMMAGAFLGILCYFVFQDTGSLSQSYETILNVLQDGYLSETGHEMVDQLLSRGGLQDMMWTISLILCAMCFGGLMECTGCLQVIAETLLKLAKSTGSLVAVTVVSCIFVNVIAADQYLAILMPGKMYKDEFKKRGLDVKNLSRCLEDAGTLTSPLFPWNTCGAFMQNALGVHPFAYLPYAFLNIINPVISIIYGYTGITMAKAKPKDEARPDEETRQDAAAN